MIINCWRSNLLVFVFAVALQACATSDTFINPVQKSDRLVINSDYELNPGGYIGQKYLIPAQIIPAIKENDKYYIFIASDGYSTISVYGTTSPPLGFCVPKDGSSRWKFYLNFCAARLKALPDHEFIRGAEVRP